MDIIYLLLCSYLFVQYNKQISAAIIILMFTKITKILKSLTLITFESVLILKLFENWQTIACNCACEPNHSVLNFVKEIQTFHKFVYVKSY